MYSGRRSMIPSTGRRTPASSRFTFPVYSLPEIAESLKACEINVTAEDLAQPRQQFIQNLFNQILQELLGISINISQLHSAAEYAVQQDVQQHIFVRGASAIEDISDAQLMLANKPVLFRFMQSIGVSDFSILDVVKPEPERVRRVLSTVVNYAKYRVHNCNGFYDAVRDYEDTVKELQNEMTRRGELEEKIEQLEQDGEQFEDEMKQLEEQRATAEAELLRYSKKQTEYTDGHVEYKQKKTALMAAINDNGFLADEAKAETERLRPYVITNPETEHKVLRDLNAMLAQTRDKLDKIERRTRELELAAVAIKAARGELDKCVRTLHECAAESQREDESRRKLGALSDRAEQRGLAATEVDREVQMVERQLRTAQDKIERVQATMLRRKDAARREMAALNDKYSTLVAERSVNDLEIKRLRDAVLATEQEMASMRAALESDIRQFEAEAQRLEATILKYMKDMERKMR